MDPDRYFQENRDDALANQLEANQIETFVAMPFATMFSYDSRAIFNNVICKAAEEASERSALASGHTFARPKRVDDATGPAIEITDDIVKRILESHIFLADLTFQNAGVMLEVGIAMGMKPSKNIILIMQGNLSELHFDIKDNHAIQYRVDSTVSKIADAMVAAAKDFEANAGLYAEKIKRQVTPGAMVLLISYAVRFLKDPKALNGLHDQGIPPGFHDDIENNEALRKSLFNDVLRELLDKRLMFQQAEMDTSSGVLTFAAHATDYGWFFIKEISKGKYVKP